MDNEDLKAIEKLLEEAKQQKQDEKENPEPEKAKGNENKEADKDKETYIKALAEAEAKEKSEIVQDPSKALNVKLSESIASTIENSKEVSEKVSTTAHKIVDKGLKAQENKADASVIDSEDETLEADFRKNKNEYLYHGIDHKIDKKWKRSLLHFINDIWFVIWAIVSFFTIVPVSTFLSRIKALSGFIKGVAVILGILLLLACLGGLTYMCLKWCGVV